MKKCSKCGRELPVECFSKNKKNSDGLQSHCKECVKQYRVKYYQTHREHELEQKKQYNDEHKEEVKQYGAKYRAEHVDYFKQYNTKYYVEHKEEIKQRHAERYAMIEGYAYYIRYTNLQADREQGRIGMDEDPLPSLDYYIWALQQPDFYDDKQYHWSEMGLDRIYNDKPHTFANVVPCSTANNRRRNQMAFDEFRELMKIEKMLGEPTS